MKRTQFILLLILALPGCKKVIVPDIDAPEPIIVIEGVFTSLPESHTVRISYSRAFDERPYYPVVENSTVEIEDDEGTIIPFYYHSGGLYKSDTNTRYVAAIGRTYVLRVITAEGDVYESTPQTVVQSPEIYQLYCNYDQEIVLTENVYGDAYEIQMDGINVFGETNGILPVKNYYFYRWKAYEQHVTVVLDSNNNQHYLYRHRRINGKYLRIILTGNADEFGNFQIRNKKLVFIVKEDMLNYIQPFPDTLFSFADNRFEGLLFKLEQLSLTDEAYSFWKDAELQLEAAGHLFDPIVPQMQGNIRCVSDTTKNVIGIFNASDVSEKYSYFYINYANRTISKEIDSFPELWLDTCHYGMPDDWIRVPF